MAEAEGGCASNIELEENAQSVGLDTTGSSPSVDCIEIPSGSGKAKKRKRTTSEVWTLFDKRVEKNPDGSDVIDPDGKVAMRAVCRSCNARLVYGGSNGMSHLIRHKASCGKKTSDSSGQPIIGRTETGEVYHFTFNQKVARRATVRYFVSAEIPFNKVDQPSFHKWIKDAFGPQFKPPSRVTLRNDAIQMFHDEKANLKALFAAIPGKICLTSDLWTSIQKLSYMCITAHFISSDWKLNQRIISFYALPSPHTGRVIGEAIYAQLLEWDIHRKIGTITLDNASNNDSAVTYLKDKLFGDDALARSLFQLRCNAHIMNLVVHDGLSHMESALKNIRESVKHVSCSPARLQKFRATCKELNLKERTLPLDVETRWDSTYLMLEAAIPYEMVFDHFFLGSDYAYVPSPNDWKNACVIRDFFKVFCETTKLFSGSKYVTSSLFCYQLSKIALCLNKYAQEPAFKPMYNDMKSKYDKYWKQVPLVLGLASCMDPRYKMSALDLCLDLNSDSRQSSRPPPPPPPPGPNPSTHFTSLLAQIQSGYGGIRTPAEPVISERERKLQPYQVALSDLFDSYQRKMGANPGDFNEDVNLGEDDIVFAMLSQRRDASIQNCKSDLQRYLDQPAIRVNNKDFDVLNWWKMEAATYPVLSVVARDLLTIPVSTVPSESAFSGGSRVVSKSRSCLLPETVEALICLEDWFKVEDGTQFAGSADVEQLMSGQLL